MTIKRLYVKLNDTNWPNTITDLGVMRQVDYSWGQTAQLYQMTYPADSGGNRRQLTYAYDGLMRPQVLTDGTPFPLVSGVTYGPGSEMKTLTHLGWSLGANGYYYQEQRQYNNRLQLTRITGNFLTPRPATALMWSIAIPRRRTTARSTSKRTGSREKKSPTSTTA